MLIVVFIADFLTIESLFEMTPVIKIRVLWGQVFWAAISLDHKGQSSDQLIEYPATREIAILGQNGWEQTFL